MPKLSKPKRSSKPEKPTYKIELLHNQLSPPDAQPFFWRVIHKNGNEICRSSENYARRGPMVKALNLMLSAIEGDDYEVVMISGQSVISKIGN